MRSKEGAENFPKHKVSFTKATTVFSVDLSITIDDPDHFEEEEGYVTQGRDSLEVLK